MTRKQLLLLSLAVEGLLAILAIGIGLLLRMPLHAWVVWSLHGLAWGAAGTLALLILLELSRRSRLPSVLRLMRLVNTHLKPLFRNCGVFDLLVISLLAGIGEELFFRGLLQGLLTNWLGIYPALTAASILFGIAHCLSREYFVFATLMGVVLGGMVLVTGDLLASILAHAAYDFVALLILTRTSPSNPYSELE